LPNNGLNLISYTIASRFYITPARNALARLPRELLASGQACEAGGFAALKKGNSYTIKLVRVADNWNDGLRLRFSPSCRLYEPEASPLGLQAGFRLVEPTARREGRAYASERTMEVE
jgi:hypothetical protein